MFAAAKHIIQLVEDAEPFVDGSAQSARNYVSGIGIDDVVGGSELLRPIRTPPVRGVKPISLAQAQAFQSVDRSGRPSGRSLTGRVVLAMIKPRAAAAGLPASTCCHTFRATSIMA